MPKILTSLLTPPLLISSINKPVQEETWKVVKTEPIKTTPKNAKITELKKINQPLMTWENKIAKNAIGIETIATTISAQRVTTKLMPNKIKAISMLINQLFKNSFQP